MLPPRCTRSKLPRLSAARSVQSAPFWALRLAIYCMRANGRGMATATLAAFVRGVGAARAARRAERGACAPDVGNVCMMRFRSSSGASRETMCVA